MRSDTRRRWKKVIGSPQSKSFLSRSTFIQLTLKRALLQVTLRRTLFLGALPVEIGEMIVKLALVSEEPQGSRWMDR